MNEVKQLRARLDLLTKVVIAQTIVVAYPQPGSQAGLKHGEITTERVDIREPDGTLRMVIADHTSFPGLIKYDASQIVQIAGVDDREDRFAGLIVRDSNPKESRRRVWVGRDENGTASVALLDANGKKRIEMSVAAGGTPSIAFLDAAGNVMKQIAP